MKVSGLQALILPGLLALTSTATADNDYGPFDYPFLVYGGGFWPTLSSEVGINGDVLPPAPPISIEDTLNVPDGKGVGWGGATWHFKSRHALELEYFSLKRNGSVSDTFTPPIQVGDSFIEGGSINTSYDTTVTRLTYGYSILSGERSRLLLKGGLHIAKLQAGLGLSGQICLPTTVPTTPPGCPAAGTSASSEDVTAPMPHFGAAYTYLLTPSLAVRMHAMGFAISLESIDGSIVDIGADVAWQFAEHFGVGAGARYFNAKVSSEGDELNGEFKFDYFGPTLYIYATF